MGSIPLSPDYMLRSPGIVSLRALPGAPAGHPAILSTRSVPSPSKVSPGIWHPGDLASGRGYPTLTWVDQESGLHGQAGAIILIQRSSGCRIGEVLDLSTKSIVSPDLLLIMASKGSRPRAVRVPELQQQFARLLLALDHPLFSLSYSQVYRQYKACGIVEYRPHNTYNRVTHSLRKDYIQAVQVVTKDVNLTKDIVGHKSKRSTIIYLQKGT